MTGSSASLTMLSSMADADFERALQNHCAWGLHWLDLKDGIFGKRVFDLDSNETRRVSELTRQHDLQIYCVSSELFGDDVELGEQHFLAEHVAKVERLIVLAKALNPVWIRLLAARSSRRSQVADVLGYLRDRHSWLFGLYRGAVERIARAGFRVTLENEVNGCILRTPAEVLGLFEELDCGDRLAFTFDVGNLWQEGTLPSVDVYHQLAHLTGYLHLKGGRTGADGQKLCFKAALEDTSWPVLPIVDAYLKQGLGSVICLNPPHGRAIEGYDYAGLAERDLEFVQRFLVGPEIGN